MGNSMYTIQSYRNVSGPRDQVAGRLDRCFAKAFILLVLSTMILVKFEPIL